MKSFFSKILVLTLLAFTASVSVAREDKPLGCWLSAGADSQKSFSKIVATNFYCPVDISSTDFNIGKVWPYEEGQIPECWHTDQGGYSEISHGPVRVLYTSYDNLKKIIMSRKNQSGAMHESITAFNARFPSCNNENDGHSLASQKPQAKPATAVAQVTLRELCLKEEIDTQNNTHAIRIGYWIPNVNQCRIFDDSPSYAKTTTKQQSQASTRDRAADDEFVCEGFEMVNRGWAGKEYGSGIWNKDYNCNKHVNKEECCKFAQQESSCDYLSWDPKGKCCCGPDMDFKDRGRGDANIGLKRK